MKNLSTPLSSNEHVGRATATTAARRKRASRLLPRDDLRRPKTMVHARPRRRRALDYPRSVVFLVLWLCGTTLVSFLVLDGDDGDGVRHGRASSHENHFNDAHPVVPSAKPDNGSDAMNEVNCGQHSAPSCGQCPLDSVTSEDRGRSWCNGDCAWRGNGTCVRVLRVNEIRKNGCDFQEFVRHFRQEELDISCHNIHELKQGEEAGRGKHRTVRAAMWRDKRVAVKEFHGAYAGRIHSMENVLQEASVLFQLRKSDYITRIVGWCNATIILEYAPLTLGSLLFNEQEDISVERAMVLGLDVVKGIEQLHSIGVSHNDVSFSQYLVTPMGRVVLGDFDAMKYVGNDRSGEKCTYVQEGQWKGWNRPPEKMLKRKFDEKGDIYGVALVLWALAARRKPFHHIKRA